MNERLAARVARAETRAGTTPWDEWENVPLLLWPEEAVDTLFDGIDKGCTLAQAAMDRISDADLRAALAEMRRLNADSGDESQRVVDDLR